MKQPLEHIELLLNRTKDYVETTLAIYKLEAIDLTANLVSSLASKLLIVFILAMFLLFFNIGFSLYIGGLLQAYHKGFLITALFYLILTVVFLIVRKRFVKGPITDFILLKLQDHKRTNTSTKHDI